MKIGATTVESATSAGKGPEEKEVVASPSKSETQLKSGAAKPPPVPAFKAPPRQKEEEQKGIDSLFQYQAIFKMPESYIKQKEEVFEGYENFSLLENNYEIS